VRREGVPEVLRWEAKGDWKQARESAQQDEGPEGSWGHAYLDRKRPVGVRGSNLFLAAFFRAAIKSV
jgi:hypothetical protein